MTVGRTRGPDGESPTDSTDVTEIDRDAGFERDPVYAVVSAVAEANGTDPLELPPLNDAVDPDALNALFAPGRESTVSRLSFRYAGYEVTIGGNGDVDLAAEDE